MVKTDVTQGLSKVPPFPPIAARLLALLSNDSVDLDAVADLVRSDPTFSARLLQCANSVEFGLEFPVSDVARALTLLGLDRTREATITLATAAYTKGALQTEELRRCWEHTVATAIVADRLARACGVFTDVAYTAGIVHDIGRLGLLVAYPKEYERIIRDAARHCLDLLDFESEQFGVHHAEAGRLLAERWGLPEEFLVIAGRHHDPCEGSELTLLRIVHVACRLADSLGYYITRPLLPLEADAILAELPTHDRRSFKVDPDSLRAQIEGRIRSFDSNDASSDHSNDAGKPSERFLASAVAGESPVEQAPGAPSQPKPAGRSVGLYIAAALITALVTAALLLWR